MEQIIKSLEITPMANTEPIEYPCLIEVLMSAKKAGPNEKQIKKIEKLNKEIDEILSSNDEEEILKYLLIKKLGSGYYYPSEWRSARDWLCHIKQLIEKNS